jgi:carboxymethylenebutenolidase
MSDGVQTEKIVINLHGGGKMPAYVARPAGESLGGLLVFQEAFGVNAHIRDITERFAGIGYTAVAPALFYRTDAEFEGSYTDFEAVREHIGALTDDGLVADIVAAYNWLANPSGGGVSCIAAIGYCMGGRAAFLANAVVPLKAAVSYYGGGIAPNPMRQGDLLDRAQDQHAPILLVWGGKDGHIGPEQRNAVEQSLIDAGKSYVQTIFGDAEHGFFCDARASYHPIAARVAWPMTLAFIESALR